MTSPALIGAVRGLRDWLQTAAWPYWLEHGIDRGRAAFHESIPCAADFRRLRVVARQTYVFSQAHRASLPGAAEAVALGINFLRRHAAHAAGGYAWRFGLDNRVTDPTHDLYDQAFVLLALASATAVQPADDLRLAALHVVAWLDRVMAHPEGGYREAEPAPAPTAHRRQNPHMHLLEACLAWSAIDNAPVWNALVDEIVGLCLSKFIDANGALHEFFAEDWSYEPTIEGRIVEPGHQFEWAWLLERWARLRGRADARQAARRLFEIGKTYGVDQTRGVAFDQLLDDFSIHQQGARLWPQTERIKASVILAGSAETPDEKAAYIAEATAAIAGLELYFSTSVAGLWRDKMKPDGTFVDEPAPASSFYHIVCAIAELRDC